MNRKSIFFLAALLIALAGTAVADSSHWLHVRVDEGDGGAKVMVNLPLSLMEKALPMIPEEHFRGGRIVIDELEVTAQELRDLWQEIKASPDMTFVTVQEDDENVRVWKQGEFLSVDVNSDTEGAGENVQVRIPMAVIDALLSGNDDELDLHSAVKALAEYGDGELVTVHDDDTQVRVWVDQTAEAD